MDRLELALAFVAPDDAVRLFLTSTESAARLAVGSADGLVNDYWRAACEKRHPRTPRATATTTATDWYAAWRTSAAEGFMKDLRKAKLQAALATEGLELRSDSALCARYIETNGDGGVAFVVEKMAEMHFFYRRTDYQRERVLVCEAAHARARELATAALLAGEETGIDVDDFLELPDAAALGAAAKDRALRAVAARLRRQAGSAAHAAALAQTWGVPVSLRARLRVMIDTHDNDAPDSASAREGWRDVQRRVRQRHDRDREVVEPFVRQMRAIPESEEGRIEFPTTLTRDQRVMLHDEADELGLMHESKQVGPNRQLSVWRWIGDLE